MNNLLKSFSEYKEIINIIIALLYEIIVNII